MITKHWSISSIFFLDLFLEYIDVAYALALISSITGNIDNTVFTNVTKEHNIRDSIRMRNYIAMKCLHLHYQLTSY